MKLCLNLESGAFDRACLRRAAEAELGENELWLLLALVADPTLLNDFEACADELADELGLVRSDLDKALGFLMGAGLVKKEGGRRRATPKTEARSAEPKPAAPKVAEPKVTSPKRAEVSELPRYTTEEFIALMERRHELGTLIDEAQNALGKTFNQTEIRQLVALSEGFGLEDEYILLLLAYCRRQEKCNMRYVEKLAVSLYDTGVITPEALTERIRQLEAAETAEGLVKRLFGFSRSLTAKEKGFVADWTGAFAFGDAMIEKAYELAVEATPNPNLNYLHSILTRWHEEGIKTPEDADRDRAARKEGRATPAPTTKSAPKTANPPKATSFDVDDFFAAAINRGYGNKK